MAERKSSYVRLDDGTTWPDPGDPNEVQWQLRYGTPSKADLLVAASMMFAYQDLIAQPASRRAEVVRGLRAARTSVPPSSRAVTEGGE